MADQDPAAPLAILLAARRQGRARHRDARRRAAEAGLRGAGLGAIWLALGLLALLLGSVLVQGLPAFRAAYIKLDINFDPARLAPEGDPARLAPDGETAAAALAQADYAPLVTAALERQFPELADREQRRLLRGLVSIGAADELRRRLLADPGLLGQTRAIWLLADDDVDQLLKGRIDRAAPAADRRLSDRALSLIDRLAAEGRLAQGFSPTLLTAGDSREPELAGLRGALVGSLYLLLVTALLSLPTGIAAAIYLEELAPRNAITDLIEVNVNNLAAVPSIVFGLLGLAVLLDRLDLPRSSPLVGGATLALLVLPTIVVTSRAALRAVPPPIRQAALGIGASRLQTVTHHVLPCALPGILTGAIIGLAQALGETAPLLLIGMHAFIVDAPRTPLDPATALPVQIYLWAGSPEPAFAERAAAAILVLLCVLAVTSGLAALLRSRAERRW